MSRVIAFLAAALVAGVAHAYPTEERGRLDGGAGTSGLAVSDDGRYIATSQRSDGAGLAVWDRLTPRAAPLLVDVCEAVDVVWTTHVTMGDAFYVGCASNEIVRVELDTTTVPPTARADDPIVVGTTTETVKAVGWTDGDTVIHVVTAGDSLGWMHVVDIASGVVDGGIGLPTSDSGAPVDVGVSGSVGASPVAMAMADGGLVLAARSGSTWTPQPLQPLSGVTVSAMALDPSGIAGFILLTTTTGEAWSVDEDTPSIVTEFDSDLSSPVSAAFVARSSGSPVVYIVGSNNEIDVFDSAGTWLESFDLSSTGSSVGVVADPTVTHTVYVAGGDGGVQVVTDRPWVSAIAADPTSLGAGEAFTVSFTVDHDCTYDLRIGAGTSATAGASLVTGSAIAETEVVVTLSSDELTSEGANRLSLFVTSGGATGLDSVVVTLDTPPDPVIGFAVASGDGRLLLTWTSTDEEDIAIYRIYVSDEAFEGGDEELPVLELTDEDGASVSYPLDLQAGAASAGQSTSVTGLANASVYWVAVQPIDDAGNEGPVSAVLFGSPEQTCGLVECSDDPGCSCAQGRQGPRVALWFVLAPAMALLRRRR